MTTTHYADSTEFDVQLPNFIVCIAMITKCFLLHLLIYTFRITFSCIATVLVLCSIHVRLYLFRIDKECHPIDEL